MWKWRTVLLPFHGSLKQGMTTVRTDEQANYNCCSAGLRYNNTHNAFAWMTAQRTSWSRISYSNANAGATGTHFSGYCKISFYSFFVSTSGWYGASLLISVANQRMPYGREQVQYACSQRNDITFDFNNSGNLLALGPVGGFVQIPDVHCFPAIHRNACKQLFTQTLQRPDPCTYTAYRATNAGCSSSSSNVNLTVTGLWRERNNIKSPVIPRRIFAMQWSARANMYDLVASTDPTATDDITVNLMVCRNLPNRKLLISPTAAALRTNRYMTAALVPSQMVSGLPYYIAIKHRKQYGNMVKTPGSFLCSNSEAMAISSNSTEQCLRRCC